MTDEIIAYHREREAHCLAMAEGADDPELKKRHLELAELHAGLASSILLQTAA